MAQLKLPIGIENFKKIRTEGYYYVDKTDVIRQILEDGCFVTLFTRPRRFGKSLNMSMLKLLCLKDPDTYPMQIVDFHIILET